MLTVSVTQSHNANTSIHILKTWNVPELISSLTMGSIKSISRCKLTIHPNWRKWCALQAKHRTSECTKNTMLLIHVYGRANLYRLFHTFRIQPTHPEQFDQCPHNQDSLIPSNKCFFGELHVLPNVQRVGPVKQTELLVSTNTNTTVSMFKFPPSTVVITTLGMVCFVPSSINSNVSDNDEC